MAVEILWKNLWQVGAYLSAVDEEEEQAAALLYCLAIFQSSAVEEEQLLLQRSISLWRQMTVQISLECSLPLERQLSYLEWLMLNWNSMVLL